MIQQLDFGEAFTRDPGPTLRYIGPYAVTPALERFRYYATRAIVDWVYEYARHQNRGDVTACRAMY